MDSSFPGAPTSLTDQLLRGDLFAVGCPSRVVLSHVTSRWGVLVLIALGQGTKRFGELRRMVGGINERMLAQTLVWLKSDGLVTRRAFEVVPPHVEYSLTPLGREASEKVGALAEWIESQWPVIAGHRNSESTGRPT